MCPNAVAPGDDDDEEEQKRRLAAAHAKRTSQENAAVTEVECYEKAEQKKSNSSSSAQRRQKASGEVGAVVVDLVVVVVDDVVAGAAYSHHHYHSHLAVVCSTMMRMGDAAGAADPISPLEEAQTMMNETREEVVWALHHLLGPRTWWAHFQSSCGSLLDCLAQQSKVNVIHYKRSKVPCEVIPDTYLASCTWRCCSEQKDEKVYRPFQR